ncbi:hypothetical protein [Stackebrandtia albiflava]
MPVDDEPNSYAAFEGVKMPYVVSGDDEMSQIDFQAQRNCWVADTVQVVGPDHIVLAGECVHDMRYMVVSYDTASGVADVVAEWNKVFGLAYGQISTAWVPEPDGEVRDGWLSYDSGDCASVAWIEDGRFVPWDGLDDDIEVDGEADFGYQEVECWAAFHAGQVVVSPDGVMAMVATHFGTPFVYVHSREDETLWEYELPAEATGVSFCGPDGNLAVALQGDDPRIVLLNPDDGDTRVLAQGAYDGISCAPDGGSIAVVESGTGSMVRTLSI